MRTLKHVARAFGLVGLILSASSTIAHAQQSFPMILTLEPLAVQAGAPASENTVVAKYNLYGAYDVFVNGDGVSGEPVAESAKPAPKKTDEKQADDKSDASAKPEVAAKPEVPKLRVRFTADADAQPGVREFRVATPQGLSTVGQLIVVRDPVVVETKGNDTADKATPVVLPAAICGTIEAAEDVDYFKFAVKAGQSLSFHVRSARCQDKIHDLQQHSDPIIALKNSSGTVLAASDNYFSADPALAYSFKQDGDYYLEVRDVRYLGNAYWQYCVEVNDRPLPATVVPSVVGVGKQATVVPVGLNVPVGMTAEVAAAADLPEGIHWLTPRVGKDSLPPVPVFVADVPVTLEPTRPHGTPTEAADVSLPTVVAGTLSAPNEADYYAFVAKKDEAFTLEIIARRMQSSLDSVLAIYDEAGKRLIESDDHTWHRLSTSDSLIESFVAKADGRYIVEVRDLHQRGGEGFSYALSMRRAVPTFALHADVDKVLMAGETGGCVYVKALRKNGFTGEIELSVEGLPKGMHADCGRILADGQDGVIVFSGDKGLQPTTARVRIVGRSVTTDAASKESPLVVVAQPWQETYMPGGGRGHYPVESILVSACDPMDVTKITVSETEIKLKPGESKKIDVTIEKAGGFEKGVTLDLLIRHLNRVSGDSLPKGVTIDEKQSKLIISAKDAQGYITLKAAPDAPEVSEQLVPVMAQAAINFVMKMSYCGTPLRVSVVK